MEFNDLIKALSNSKTNDSYIVTIDNAFFDPRLVH